MAGIWTEQDERELQAMQQRKTVTFEAARAELLRDLEAVVPKHSGSTYSGHYSPREVADALIKNGGMFRDALAPFDHMGRPVQEELPINVPVDVSGWTVHDGKEVPVDARDRVRVEVEYRSGVKNEGWAEDFDWERDTDDALRRKSDIVAYRLLPMPEWHPWAGGEQPEADEAFVEVHFRGSVPGYTITEYAENLTWTHDPTDNESDIVCYRVIS